MAPSPSTQRLVRILRSPRFWLQLALMIYVWIWFIIRPPFQAAEGLVPRWFPLLASSSTPGISGLLPSWTDSPSSSVSSSSSRPMSPASLNHPLIYARLKQSMQRFEACERTPDRIHRVRVICRGRDSGCLETTHRLFDVAIRSGRQVTLQHCAKTKPFRSDIGLEWRRCPGVSSNLYPTKLLCPNRLLDPVETRRAAQCIDGKLLNRTPTISVEPCDVNPAGSQLCFASSTLDPMDELCYRLAKVVDESLEGPFGKRRLATRSPTTSLAPRPLPWTANDSRVSRCVQGRAGNSTTLSAEDVAKMVESCQKSAVREDEWLLGLGTAFVLATVLGILGAIFRTLASYRRARQGDDDVDGGGVAVVESGQDWQRHRASVQENNRGFFSDTRIPEEEAGDWDDPVIPPPSSIQRTSRSRWRFVFPWMSRGTMSLDDSPRRHQQRPTGRYDGDDDAIADQETEQQQHHHHQQQQQQRRSMSEVPGATTFIIAPASGHTVGKRLLGKKMMMMMERAGPNPKISTNPHEDTDGNMR